MPFLYMVQSVLIFESSASGYFEAECLHKDLAEKGLDRNGNFFSGGVRQLYGFIATKKDMDEFNEHCQGSLPYKMIYVFKPCWSL